MINKIENNMLNMKSELAEVLVVIHLLLFTYILHLENAIVDVI